eukprot:127331_1
MVMKIGTKGNSIFLRNDAVSNYQWKWFSKREIVPFNKINDGDEIYSEIKSFGGKCLEIFVDDLFVDGGKVQIWNCNNAIQQQWKYNSLSGEVVNNGGKCLDVDYDDYHANINGAKVQIWECNKWDNQKWIIIGNYIISKNGKCLDIDAPQLNDNGGLVQLWNCGTENNQLWVV